jgi:hypothetical protein
MDRPMIVPRVGALVLLVGFGYGLVTYAKLAYVTGVEGYWSWATTLAFLLPTGVLGVLAAILVLRRHALGQRLAVPFAVITIVSALLSLVGAPPVGGFLDDYEEAALARGVDVPAFEEAQGVTPQEWVEKETSDVRSQGAVGAIVLAIVYVATVLRGSRSRKAPQAAPRTSAP